MAFVAGLLFLLSPYQAEPVIWKVCIHYLLIGTLTITSLYYYTRYLEERVLKDLCLSLASFLPSLFLLEMSFATPLIIGAYSVLWLMKQDRPKLGQALVPVLPYFAFLGSYLLLTRLAIGSFIGHYGSEEHLSFPVEKIIGDAFMYLLKYTGFTRYWDFQVKEALYSSAIDAPWAYVFGGLLIGFVILALLKFKRLDASKKLSFVLVILFFTALLPIINLYVAYQQWVEGDRYGYLASMFFYASISVLILGFRWKWKYALLILFAVAELFTLLQTTRAMGSAGMVSRSLVEDFRWWGRDHVMVLAIGDNYKGSFIYQVYGDQSTFGEAVALMRSEFRGQMDHVLLFNMNDKTDGVNARWIDERTIEVAFNRWGSWWWKDGLGAGDFETDTYQVTIDGHRYRLKFKVPPKPNTAIIYQDGMRWRELEPRHLQGDLWPDEPNHFCALMKSWESVDHPVEKNGVLGEELNRSRPFSSEMIIPINEKNVHAYSEMTIKLEALSYLSEDSTENQSGQLVLLVQRAGETIFWKSLNLGNEMELSHWQWTALEDKLPSLQIEDKVKCHVWNTGDQSVVLRKMQLSTLLPHRLYE